MATKTMIWEERQLVAAEETGTQHTRRAHLEAYWRYDVVTFDASFDDGTDDGPGAGNIREGVGISNTRARLEQLYGDAARLELGNAQGGGFRASVHLPAHTEPLHASPDRR
jgi:hypothetical protein